MSVKMKGKLQVNLLTYITSHPSVARSADTVIISDEGSNAFSVIATFGTINTSVTTDLLFSRAAILGVKVLPSATNA